MVLLKTLRSHHFLALFILENPLNCASSTTHSINLICSASIIIRSISLSAQSEQNLYSTWINSENKGEAKTLKKLKGLEKGVSNSKEYKLKNGTRDSIEKDNSKNTEKKKKFELNDGVFKDKATGSLSTLFCRGNPGKRLRRDEPIVCKELPSNAVEFARLLYERGYFRDAHFLAEDKFDASCFQNIYGRNYFRNAAEKFGRDYQEIAKWIPGSELKKIAVFGCPSLSKKVIFSAKTLRTFFKIPENVVCSKCVLRRSCKFVNQNVWNNTKNLHLPVVMNVISIYALESVPMQLKVPNEVKSSVSRLLEVVAKLSRTVSRK